MKLSDRAIYRLFSAIFLTLVLAISALVVAPPRAHAEAGYPNRPVRIVVPFAAGGVADTTARIIAEKLGDKLGQRFSTSRTSRAPAGLRRRGR